MILVGRSPFGGPGVVDAEFIRELPVRPQGLLPATPDADLQRLKDDASASAGSSDEGLRGTVKGESPDSPADPKAAE